MKLSRIYQRICFVLVCCSLNSCAVSKVNPDAKDIDQVYFFQNGISHIIKDDFTELRLKREPFAIQFFNKAFSKEPDGYNISRLVAVPNQEEFDKITIGVETKKTVNLEKWSALAVSTKTGYAKQLFINDYGHHILYYTNEEERTVDVIGRKGDYLLFQFEVALIFDKPDFMPIADSDLDTIFFAVFSDFNKNKIIDSGELTKVKLNLE